MERKYDILDKLKKRIKPELERGFFESFLARLMTLISKEHSSSSEDLSFEKAKKPHVPDGFFEKLLILFLINYNCLKSPRCLRDFSIHLKLKRQSYPTKPWRSRIKKEGLSRCVMWQQLQVPPPLLHSSFM